MALVDFLKDGLFVRRMHSDPRIRAVELLLQEQVPHSVPLQNPESENVTGTQRLVPELLETVPWRVQLSTPIPQVHLLSNGAMTSLVSQSGSGFLRWQDVDLTRWQPDAVTDRHGIWIYASEAGEDRPSLLLPTSPFRHADRVVSTFHSHMQVIKKTVRGIASTLEVTLSPEDPVEIRRVHLSNPTNRRRRLRLDSYGEVILAPQAADARHPAFNKLFIQSEYIPEYNLLLFRRRPRSESETGLPGVTLRRTWRRPGCSKPTAWLSWAAAEAPPLRPGCSTRTGGPARPAPRWTRSSRSGRKWCWSRTRTPAWPG